MSLFLKVQLFRLAGLPVDPDGPDEQAGPLDFGAVGITFLEAVDSTGSVIITARVVPDPAKISLADAIQLLQILAGKPQIGSAYKDVNQNDRTDMGDAIAVLQYLSNQYL